MVNHPKSALTLAVLGLCIGMPTAQAKEEFPRQIAEHLGAPSPPPCSLCHQYGKTGKDTLVTPFAWAMRARGMTGGSSLTEALDRMAADRVDSDGDGVTDLDEIVAGTDPNSAASTPGAPGTVVDPQLGCRLGGEANQRCGPTWLLVVAGMAARRSKRR